MSGQLSEPGRADGGGGDSVGGSVGVGVGVGVGGVRVSVRGLGGRAIASASVAAGAGAAWGRPGERRWLRRRDEWGEREERGDGDAMPGTMLR